MRTSIVYLWIVLVFLLSGCSLPTPRTHVPQFDGLQGRNLIVFFDGTENGPSDKTNVIKLHDMILEEGAPDILTFYIEGVGVGGKMIGAGTGWGIDYRVREAYGFLLDHYRDGDKIHIFGFSRGAFSARILAAMIYYAGLPKDPVTLCNSFEEKNSKHSRRECLSQISEVVYDAYKGEKNTQKRIDDITSQLKGIGLQFSRPVRVSTLGLWDTVEAFGLVDTWEAIKIKLLIEVLPDPGERNRRYGDQLCNVDLALHALSIDDNRGDVFTPKLLTLPHLFNNCESKDLPREPHDFSKVKEVWFSGAHSDVGGGYGDCDEKAGCISHISLNWMIHQLVVGKTQLFSKETHLEANTLSRTHNAEDGSWLYRRVQRDVFSLVEGSRYNQSRPQVHCSVIQRLAQKLPKDFEYQWDIKRDACFKIGLSKYEYLGSKDPGNACSDDTLDPNLQGCWFSVVK